MTDSLRGGGHAASVSINFVTIFISFNIVDYNTCNVFCVFI